MKELTHALEEAMSNLVLARNRDLCFMATIGWLICDW